MAPEYLPLIGAVVVAFITVGGIWLKGVYDARLAKAVATLDDRAKLTASTLAEVDSLRKDSDVQENQMRQMRAEIQQAQRDNFAAQRANLECERRCGNLTAKVAEMELKLTALEAMIERWRAHTGLAVPP